MSYCRKGDEIFRGDVAPTVSFSTEALRTVDLQPTIVSLPRLLPVDEICGLPTPWNCWYGELGLSSTPKTLQFRPHPFETVYQQLWHCLPDQFRHLRGNSKRQRDDGAHQMTTALYTCTHYYNRKSVLSNTITTVHLASLTHSLLRLTSWGS